jgi:hypothetical protein
MSPRMIRTGDIGSGDWVRCADSINKVVHVIGKAPYQWQSFILSTLSVRERYAE